MRNSLRVILSKFPPETHPWVLAGNTALVLQGIPLVARDLTLIMNRSQVYEFGKVFRANIITGITPQVSTPRHANFTGEFDIYGVKVTVIGDLLIRAGERSLYMMIDEFISDSNTIEFMGRILPVISLEWQILLDILQGNQEQRLDKLVEGEPDIEKISLLIERHGLGRLLFQDISSRIQALRNRSGR